MYKQETVLSYRYVGSEISFQDAAPFVIERLKGRTVFADNGCWLLQKGLTSTGYATAMVAGMRRPAHRVSYMIHKGDIPAGLKVCHSCDTRNCWNPDHLWLGTQKDNMTDCAEKKRIYAQTKTHCPKGHPYNEEHTMHLHQRNGRAARGCRTCARIRYRLKHGWTLEDTTSIPSRSRTRAG